MKAHIFKTFFSLLFALTLFTVTPALPDLCKYNERQLTIGQKITDCFANITCLPRGMLKISDSCLHLTCERQSQLISYKAFDSQKPYPDCCSTPICRDGRMKVSRSASRIYRPKSFMKRSPHVMGIKFP